MMIVFWLKFKISYLSIYNRTEVQHEIKKIAQPHILAGDYGRIYHYSNQPEKEETPPFGNSKVSRAQFIYSQQVSCRSLSKFQVSGTTTSLEK